MASKSKLKGKSEMTLEDQKKINAFANANAAYQDVKEEIEARKKEVQNLSDGSDDVLMMDDGVKVPYVLGEVFIDMEQDEAQEMMETAKTTAEARLTELQEKASGLQATMKKLKVDLYAKFGDNINLESEE